MRRRNRAWSSAPPGGAAGVPPDDDAPVTIDIGYDSRPQNAAVYLVRHGTEALFVDAGTSHSTAALLAALDVHNVPREAVRYVLLTHAHLDHCSGLGELLRHVPAATVVCHPRAQPHLVDPQRLIASATTVYGTEAIHRLYGPSIRGVPPSRIHVMMQDAEVLSLGGRPFQVLYAPGHASHHIAFLDVARGHLYAGDAFGISFRDLLARHRLPFRSPRLAPVSAPPDRAREMIFYASSPVDFDVDAAHRTISRIIALQPQRVYICHYGAWDTVEDGALQLHGSLEHCRYVQDRLVGDLRHAETRVLGVDWHELERAARDAVTGWFAAEFTARGIDGQHPEVVEYITPYCTVNAKGLVSAAKRAFLAAGGRIYTL